jgi:3-methyladenine DNA glycosylase AlkD
MMGGAANHELVAEVRRALAEAADPAKAGPMQAYMKSAMPYRGVKSPGVRLITRRVFETFPLATVAAWRDTVLELWRGAAFREERYVAIALSGDHAYRQHQVPAAIPMYDEMIVSGAWWDYVDELAVRRLGPMLLTHRSKVEPVLRRWSTDADLWRRRTSIIGQVGLKGATDAALLAACIEPNLAGRDFFIRKAIGWSLRAYAWVEPGWVRAYVAANQSRLSGLSRREALKNIGP